MPFSQLLGLCWQSSAFLGLSAHHPDLCHDVHPPFFLCASLSSHFPLCKYTSQVRLGYTLMTSFQLNYLCEESISKQVLKYQRARTSTYKFEAGRGEHNSTHNKPRIGVYREMRTQGNCKFHSLIFCSLVHINRKLFLSLLQIAMLIKDLG